MSKELRRVPLDFDYPFGEVWHGYLNPHRPNQCDLCNRTGFSVQANHLFNQWYRGTDFHPSDTGSLPWQWNDEPIAKRVMKANLKFSQSEHSFAFFQEASRWAAHCNSWSYHLAQEDVDAIFAAGGLRYFFDDSDKTGSARQIPSAKEVNLWAVQHRAGLNSEDAYFCIKAKCERLGYAIECSACQGYGVLWDSQEKKRLHDQWRPFEPPTGAGYQLWETTSEGSPVSPVFDTLEQLCDWCETHATVMADHQVSKQQWLEMLSASGYAYHTMGQDILLL